MDSRSTAHAMAEITIYTTSYCPYCRAATALLGRKRVPFDEIDVTRDDAARADLVTRTGSRTVPQIFVDGRPIGGFDELSALDRSGRLDELLHAG
jgi:glutaredoxin 3